MNQYPGIDGNPLSYDPNGNLTAMQNTATPSSPITATYDAQSRLLTATRGTGGSADTMGVVYDPWNRPIYREVNGAKTFFVWDGWNLVAEFDEVGLPSNSWARVYVHGPGVDEMLMMQDAATGQQHFFHHDALGSTVALTDGSGALMESYLYDVFGKATVTDAATGQTAGASFHGNRFLYTGREWIAELALYDYRNRVYSAELGRFLQTDPIRFWAGDVNLYRYVGNRVVSWLDPFGLRSEGAANPHYPSQSGKEPCPEGSPLPPLEPPPIIPLPPEPIPPLKLPPGAVPPPFPPKGGQVPPGPGGDPFKGGGKKGGGGKGGGGGGGVGGAVGTIWNAPNTLIGLLWGGLGMLGGADPSFGNNALQFQNHPLMLSGITLGNTIHYSSTMGPNTRSPESALHSVGQHEAQHTLQGQMLGPAYLPANIIGGALSLMTTGSWHGNNFMERGPMSDPPKPW